jgi:CHAD domain-containing protein
VALALKAGVKEVTEKIKAILGALGEVRDLAIFPRLVVQDTITNSVQEAM